MNGMPRGGKRRLSFLFVTMVVFDVGAVVEVRGGDLKPILRPELLSGVAGECLTVQRGFYGAW
jgi:hypothetical protein